MSDLLADLKACLAAHHTSQKRNMSIELAERADVFAANFMFNHGDKLLALLEAGKAARDRLERVGSMEAFGDPGVATVELKATEFDLRIDYAREAVRRYDEAAK